MCSKIFSVLYIDVFFATLTIININDINNTELFFISDQKNCLVYNQEK